MVARGTTVDQNCKDFEAGVKTGVPNQRAPK